jgi:hypothetical protein
MAGIYKVGFPAHTPGEEAAAAALKAIRDGGDDDPVVAGPDVIQTEDHLAATDDGNPAPEYLIRYETAAKP